MRVSRLAKLVAFLILPISLLAFMAILAPAQVGMAPAQAPPSTPQTPSTKPTTLPGKATASSEEDGNPPQNAADNDDQTRWCAVDGTAPQWWRYDLTKPVDLKGIQILWEHDVTGYSYIIEGSKDGTAWKLLSDQQKNDFPDGTHNILFDPKDPKDAQQLKSIRITVKELPEGSWASFWEMRFILPK